MLKVKIKKNDEVILVTGRDSGTKGRVLKVYPSAGTAIVERANMIRRHTRPNPNKQIQGGIVEREGPLHISNVKLIDRPAEKAKKK